MIRRVLWTVGVGFGGFLLGGKGSSWWGAALGAVWAASVGYGFGSIFDQKLPTKRVVAYWGSTLGLVGIFFGLLVGAGLNPDNSNITLTIHGAIGALVGAILGVLVGTRQLKRLRRNSQGSR